MARFHLLIYYSWWDFKGFLSITKSPKQSLWIRCDLICNMYFHITNEETEAQKGELTYFNLKS